MEKKKIPILDLSKTKKLQRRNSDSEILTNRTVKRKNIDDVIQKHRETCKFIKEIHDKLEVVNTLITYDEVGIHQTMKEIRDKLSNFEACQEKTPRFMSRCDAMIGNTQVIITHTKNLMDYLKNIDYEAEQHDTITMTLLNDICKEISDIKTNVRKINETLLFPSAQ
jgi:DNA repair ATPase RecN